MLLSRTSVNSFPPFEQYVAEGIIGCWHTRNAYSSFFNSHKKGIHLAIFLQVDSALNLISSYFYFYFLFFLWPTAYLTLTLLLTGLGSRTCRGTKYSGGKEEVGAVKIIKTSKESLSYGQSLSVIHVSMIQIFD